MKTLVTVNLTAGTLRIEPEACAPMSAEAANNLRVQLDYGIGLLLADGLPSSRPVPAEAIDLKETSPSFWEIPKEQKPSQLDLKFTGEDAPA